MRYIIIILLAFINLNVFSQKIDGKVYSFFDSDKEYLEGANISIKDSPYGTTSNKNGDYSLSFNLDFPVTIIISFVGYESFEKTIANSVGSSHYIVSHVGSSGRCAILFFSSISKFK